MQSSRTFDALRAITRVALFACCTTITGCVLVPIPTALPDAEPFTAEKLAPMQVGHTTRDEVRSLFAAWPYTTDDGVQTAHIEPQASDDGRYWVFGLPRQIGDWAFAGLVMYFPGPLPVWEGKEDNFENHWVLVEFSADDTVAAFWIASDKTPCSSGGVCYHEPYLQMIADEAANEAARSSTTVSDRCVLYSYAENDFDTPVTVTDGVHTTQVLAKTSFVRTEMPAGPQTVSAWIDTIPGWIAAVSVTCVGSDVHYVALRQHDGLVDAKLQEASKGKSAIAERFLVNRLVAAQPSVAPKPKSETAWTNCTSTDPCHQLAVLDGAKGLAGMSSIAGEDGQIHAVENGTHAPHLLHPGRYTVLSYSPSRSDTFDLAAGHRYRLVNQWHYFGGAATSWFEDVATKRVVAGAKWCTSAADCPESSCSKGSKDSPAVCDIPELQCSTWRTGLGDDRPGHCAPRSGLRQADR